MVSTQGSEVVVGVVGVVLGVVVGVGVDVELVSTGASVGGTPVTIGKLVFVPCCEV